MEQTYKISLPQFEGPFDLLLFFIERDELNIYDIPIAEITKDFLDYISEMEALNIELASEFILIAASLMRIKSKMLIPRKELNEDGEEIDPREELVQRLLEYKRYKAVTAELQALEAERQAMQPRGNVAHDFKHISEQFSVESELEQVTLYKLMRAFNRVVEKMHERNAQVRHTVVPYHYTIKSEKKTLTQLILKAAKSNFATVFDDCADRIQCVFRFLSLLELIAEQKIDLTLGEGKNNFWISAKANEATA